MSATALSYPASPSCPLHSHNLSLSCNVSFQSMTDMLQVVVERYMDKMSLFLLPDGSTPLFSFHHFIFIKLFFCICDLQWMNKAALSVICIIYSFYRSFDPVIPKLININTALIYSESTLHNPHRTAFELTPAHAAQARLSTLQCH